MIHYKDISDIIIILLQLGNTFFKNCRGFQNPNCGEIPHCTIVDYYERV